MISAGKFSRLDLKPVIRSMGWNLCRQYCFDSCDAVLNSSWFTSYPD